MKNTHSTKQSAPTQTFADFNENPTYAKADVAMLGVACDITCTYGKGAWHGPHALLEASFQLEPEVPVFLHSFSQKIAIHNLGVLESAREVAKEKRAHYGFQETDRISKEMVKGVQEFAQKVLKGKKLLMTIGGDHSITNGVLNALDEQFGAENVTIVHFDAHLDLREAYDALEYSHASVMYNARTKGFPMVQIGIRDHVSEEEATFIRKNKWGNSIFWCPIQPEAFYETKSVQAALKKSKFLDTSHFLWGGKIEKSQLESLLSQIKTKYVYISLDMDALNSWLVPSTGTPLPHGLKMETVEEIIFAVLQHAKSKKRKLVGFDLTEIAPMLRDPAKGYTPENVISPLVELHAAHIAYKLLFWQFLERFT